MSHEVLIPNKVMLCPGDNLHFMKDEPENRYDSVVCDPPYLLTSIVKRFGKDGSAPAKFGTDGRFSRLSGGFMNKRWDAPDSAPIIDPAFAHWMAGFIDGEGCFHVHKKQINNCETYDCQFSITLRDDDADIVVEIQKRLGGIGTIAKRPAPNQGNGKPQIRYCVSSQKDCWQLREILTVFPLRAKKARDFEIWSQALDAWISHKPGSSWEDVAYFRDALMAVRQYGSEFHPSQFFHYRWAKEAFRVLKPGAHLVAFGGTRTYHRLACAIEDAGFEIRDQIGWAFGSGFPKSHNIGDGWGTALKPAWEPICLARKPLSEKTIAENMWRWRTGAINVEGCRVGYREKPKITDPKRTPNTYGVIDSPGGKLLLPDARWPANLLHDGSTEVLAAFPYTESGNGPIIHRHTDKFDNVYGAFKGEREIETALIGDAGSAARFFYAAKADAADRLGSKHPTVKPIDLMQWLVRLITPKGGLVLDPFAGTGTTAEACVREGLRCTLVEREAEYQSDIRRRMKLLMCGPEERKRELAKLQANGRADDHGPLFDGPPKATNSSGEAVSPGAAHTPTSETDAPQATAANLGPSSRSLLAKLRGGMRKLPVPRITES